MQKLKRQVLFSDIKETLIGVEGSSPDKVAELLNIFLQKENLLVVATSISHGSGVEAYKLCQRIDEMILKGNKARVKYFMSHYVNVKPDKFEKSKRELAEIDAENKSKLNIQVIKGKEQSVGRIISGLESVPSKMYAIGDSDADLDMLADVNHRGGKSAIITNLKDYAGKEYYLLKDKDFLHVARLDTAETREFYSVDDENVEKRAIELKLLYEKGLVDVKTLNEKIYKSFLCHDYDFTYKNKRMPQIIKQFPIYENFEQFFEQESLHNLSQI